MGLPVSRCLKALDEMRGDQELDEIAAISGLTSSVLHSLCKQLHDQGVLSFSSATADRGALVAPSTLINSCRRRFPEWKHRLFSHPLWVSLAAGTASKTLFTGWLVESFHFIEAVTGRIPMAIANCTDPKVRRIFVRHFAEEYDHHHFFAQALGSAGIDDCRREKLTPLPGTNAVRNHMRAAARLSPLAYAACSGFLESTGDDRSRTASFFECLQKHFDRPDRAIVGPMAAHAALDEGYGHSGFLESVAEAVGPVTGAQVDAALQAAYILLETLEAWSTDILRHYASPASLTQGMRRYRPQPAEQPV